MTLIELMVSVSIVGVLATAATASFTKQVAESRSVEAVSVLGAMKQAIQMTEVENSSIVNGLDFTATTFGGPAGFPMLGAPKTAEEKAAEQAARDAAKAARDAAKAAEDDAAAAQAAAAQAAADATAAQTAADQAAADAVAAQAAADEPVTDPGNGNSTAKTGGIDGDGNAGHGNNEDKCDPDNPGKSGHTKCPGQDDSDGSGSDGDFGGDGGDADSGGGEGSGGGLESLCGSATPVPNTIESVRGKIYLASASEWSSGSSDMGWQCLNMGRSGNQSYQYGYEVGAPTLPGSTESYTAWARGDVDGDGRTSMFRLRGELVDGAVVHAPAIEIVDRSE